MYSFFRFIFLLGFNLGLILLLAVGYLFYINSKDLPSYQQLANYQPPVTTRFYAGDGRLLEEYAREHRVFLPIEEIPNLVKQAFISAEDKNFYHHHGIDLTGILRAAIKNTLSGIQGKKNLVGGSTITQQVVKNFLLSNQKSINRKVKEAIISYMITKVFTKNKILELYLNEIYLGSRSYGVAAAALNYFNKSVNELNIQEAALLAALPQAPSEYSPHNKKNHQLIRARRNWVIERMREDGYITAQQASDTINTPVELFNRSKEAVAKAPFFAETVRQKIAQQYGEKALYEDGFMVRTTLDPVLQNYAENALKNGLINYDQRHGYRGPVGKINLDTNEVVRDLKKIAESRNITPWRYVVIRNINEKKITVSDIQDNQFELNLLESKWVVAGKKITNIFKPGDVILVDDNNAIKQYPKIDGAIIAMDPHTGRVLAMVGGYNFDTSKFNRATQALRQSGSSFKPFVYLAALEQGLTPASNFEDSPIALSQGPGLPLWKPKNFYHDFLGPLTLRRGLELSRNTITVRIAQHVGIDRIVEIAKRFDICKDPAPYYSMVLGAMETTVLQLTNAYAVIASGGRKVTPIFIDKIQDRHGKLIYNSDERECLSCKISIDDSNDHEFPVPEIVNNQPFVTDARSAYQLTAILEGTVKNIKQGLPIKNLGKTIAGKTGTTNGPKDLWYVGFTPDIVVGVFVGFDDPQPMGKHESGAVSAQPIFVDFIKNALKNYPDKPFKIPSGLKLAKIDYFTGELKKGSFYEVFKIKDFHDDSENHRAYVDSQQPNTISTQPENKIDPLIEEDPEEIFDEGIY